MEFRFSPRENQAHRIAWHEWGDAAFEEARERELPLLLSLSAVWCHWCHVMDETTFSDPRVIDLLNEGFVPVRVDNDRRPDINRRYNMGGWPTVAFLTPEGEVITGATYVPPGHFVDVLDRVRSLWRDQRDTLRAEAWALKARRGDEEKATPHEEQVSEEVVERVLEAVVSSYDGSHGGFGSSMKFPRADILGALVVETETRAEHGAARRMLHDTLAAMSGGGLWDPVERGFFRYATRRDWSEPHYEKMLEDNAQLIRLFAQAGIVLDDPDLVGVAQEAQAYLDATLWIPSEGAYGGSQDADEEYYALRSGPERGAHGAPYVDPMTYTDWNALEVQALTGLHAATGTGRYLEQAVTLAETLLGRTDAEGLYRHDSLADSAADLIGDQLGMLEASLALYQATGAPRWLAEAGRMTDLIGERFALDGGPLIADVATSAQAAPLGRLDRPDASLSENSRYAAALSTIGRVTRDEDQRDRASRVLAGLAPLVDGVGDFGAEFARAVAVTLREPLHITIVGRPGAADVAGLSNEAVRIPRVHKVVDILDPECDQEALARAGYSGQRDGAQAFVCVKGTCMEPVTTPEDLGRMADSILS